MYYLIINDQIVAQNTDFDVLVEKMDAEMDGYIVEAKEWEAR